MLVVLLTLAMLRLTRVAAANRRWALRAVAALGAVWVLCWVLGAQLVSHTPIASDDLRRPGRRRGARAAGRHPRPGVFAKQIKPRPVPQHAHRPAADRPARQGRPARVRRGLRPGGGPGLLVLAAGRRRPGQGDKRLQGAGFSARSGFLTSATFGGISWLAHSSLQSGLWVNSQRRYDQLIAANRFTLAQAFKRAGWRTVDDVPSNDRAWPQGESFYHYDKIYDRYQVGYHGPTFTYASMPDQYIFSALQRLELAKTHRRPLFAEVDMVSSHMPWNRIPAADRLEQGRQRLDLQHALRWYHETGAFWSNSAHA